MRRQDVELLTSVAEHRALCVRHLAVLHQRNAQALRRRLRALEAEGMIQAVRPGFTGKRGRPERVLSLREKGVAALKHRGVLDPTVPSDKVTAGSLHCLDHVLLTNDFRIQLVKTERLIGPLTATFLSPLSPFLDRSRGDQPLVRERFRSDEADPGWIEFTPDGVFTVSHAALGKSLLFFLEVDMGTEPLTSAKRPGKDVRQKIVNYQAYFRRGRYRRYEKVWGSPFRGFRLLFLANSGARLAALCRLVGHMPPSDFVWLTDRDSHLKQGVWSAIWHRGGQLGEPRLSVLGSQMPDPCPAPDGVG